MSSLYELTGQFLNLQNALSDFVNDEEGQAAIESAMAQIEGSIEEKATGYGMVIRNMEGYITAAKNEIERLHSKVKSHEANIKRMKANLQNNMEAIDKDKINTDLFTFTVQNNPPCVELAADFIMWAKANDIYLKYKDPDVDKKAILADLKAGNEIPYATIKQGRSLRIK